MRSYFVSFAYIILNFRSLDIISNRSETKQKWFKIHNFSEMYDFIISKVLFRTFDIISSFRCTFLSIYSSTFSSSFSSFLSSSFNPLYPLVCFTLLRFCEIYRRQDFFRIGALYVSETSRTSQAFFI